MIVRATGDEFVDATDSSTACASSMPVVPTITAGMPRAVNRRMSAPQGTPASGASRPSSSLSAPRTVRAQGWSGAVSPGANAPPSQASSHGARRRRAPVDDALQRGARLVEVGADGHAEPALELEPVGHHARPVAACDLAHEQRVGQLELAHQRVRDVRVDGGLVRGERLVHAHVAVDRGDAREPLRGVRGAAADLALEGQRARLGADDAQAGRLGQQRGVEARRRARAPRTCRARRPPRRRRPAARPRARRAGALDRGERVQRGDTAPFMSTEPRPCRRPSGDRARPRLPRLGPGQTTSTCPLRRAVAPSPGSVAVTPQSSSRGASSPGWSGCARSGGEVVLVQVGVEPGGGRALGERARARHARRR